MTGLQKFIKYAALAFAIFLIVSIVGGIVSALAGMTLLFRDGEVAGEMTSYALNQDFDMLTVDLGAGDLRIEYGDSFSLESNHKYLKVTQDSHHLRIVDTKKVSASMDYKDVKIILTIPSGTSFSSASIVTGAGRVDIGFLSAQRLDMEFGAGEVQVDMLQVSQSADVETGAGKVTISQCSVRDLELDLGVGEVDITGYLYGKCDLNMGVGKTCLTLGNSPDDYTISLEKGLGEVQLDGKVIQNGTYGSGDTKLEIEGGIGAVVIEFKALTEIAE